MMRIETDIDKLSFFVSNLFEKNERKAELALKFGIADAVSMIANRVQQEGKSIEGKLETRSTKRIGAYSERHGEARQARGRQTARVDLTFEGDLMRNWQILDVSSTEAKAGFTSVIESNKAQTLEMYYGAKIFALNKTEQQDVADTIINELTRE